MRGDGSLHSRIVAVLRLVLPLAALALLSTIFLFARGPITGTPSLPYGETDIETLLREPRMTSPTFVGVTEDGAEVTFSATTARPMSPDGPGAESPILRILTPDGVEYVVEAGEGRIDPVAGLVLLSRGAQITISTGYIITADAIAATLDRTHAESLGPVVADGPQGRITAGSMQLIQADDGYVVVFKSGVKLVYAPST